MKILLLLTYFTSFSQGADSYTTNNFMLPIAFIENQQAWVLSQPFPQESGTIQGSLLRTRDGGITWEKISIPVTEKLTSVCFADNLRGWIVGSRGAVLASIDGGSSWRVISRLESDLRSVFFTSTKTGWIAGAKLKSSEASESNKQGAIFFTTDGGVHWQPLTLPSGSGPVNSLFFHDSLRGWAAGIQMCDSLGRGVVYATSNGGKKWTEQFLSRRGNYISSISFSSAEKGQIHSYNVPGAETGPLEFFTTDGGKTWDELYPLSDFQSPSEASQ